MSETSYTVICGRAVLVGKSPDGDSVRFVPDDAALLRRLVNGSRVRISADGSVQLRFDGVDAPELHYKDVGQPQGASARDALLAHLGFATVTYAPDGATVASASPSTITVVVLARMVEVNGRPVAVVFAAGNAEMLRDAEGTAIELSPDLLERSVNVWEVSNGITYPLVYTSTAAELRAVFVAASRRARTSGRGVWSIDSSASFPISSAEDLGPRGALIWPKLFRRATDYLHRRTAGETLPEWLAANPAEDDAIQVEQQGSSGTDGDPVALHDLLTQSGDQVRLLPDLLDLVVVEREPPAASTTSTVIDGGATQPLA